MLIYNFVKKHDISKTLFVSYFVFATVSCYFLIITLFGQKGLIRYFDLKQEISGYELTRQEMAEKVGAKKNLVAGMNVDSLDLDLLDEEARRSLGFSNKNEVVVYEEKGQKKLYLKQDENKPVENIKMQNTNVVAAAQSANIIVADDLKKVEQAGKTSRIISGESAKALNAQSANLQDANKKSNNLRAVDSRKDGFKAKDSKIDNSYDADPKAIESKLAIAKNDQQNIAANKNSGEKTTKKNSKKNKIDKKSTVKNSKKVVARHANKVIAQSKNKKSTNKKAKKQ